MGIVAKAIKSWHAVSKGREFWVGLIVISVVGLSWGGKNLLDSPRPWFDEGIYLQVAKNVAQEGLWALRVSPQQTVGLEYVTVGFPVILPVAFSIKIFGASLLAARGTMLLWIVLGILFGGYLTNRLYGRKAGLVTALFLASFGPWYANGKNVMGEVPGLVLMLVSLIFLTKIEKGSRDWQDFFWLTIFACLAAVSKPSFLVLGPAMAFAIVILFWRGFRPTRSSAAAIITPIVLVSAVWMQTQFGGFPGSDVLHHYVNPYGLDDVGAVMRQNLIGMFTHSTPLHLLFMLALIMVALLLRGWRKTSATEMAMSTVIALTLFSYLRTAGWYRYFFVAQIMCFVLLPIFMTVTSEKFFKTKRWVPEALFLAMFLSANLFALLRDPSPMFGQDWRKMNAWLEGKKSVGNIAFINVPEAVYFYEGSDYRQYLRITDKLRLGEMDDEAEILMTPNPLPETIVLPADYAVSELLGSYAVWRKN
ncbi:MAG: glycosyltransferase family 39 protein [Patescibacteria group bacterium]|nr:glycosyltransferase family 39 protein [Patescibacteria group bacterium]